MNYWLLKSEPGCFSIEDLKHAPQQTTHWDGVRNYQARNFMKNQMQIGDLAFFYHSNCNPPGIIGVVEITSKAYPDHTAWDPENEHFDPKSTPDNPRWFMVDVRFKYQFPHLLGLDELRSHSELQNMVVLRRGNRLSITPVNENEWLFIEALAK